MKCAYCGLEREEFEFWIGAKFPEDPGFTLVEGTGKFACAACYPIAAEEGRRAVERATGIYNSTE